MVTQRFVNRPVALSLAVCFLWCAGIRPQGALAMPSESAVSFQPAAERQAQIEKVVSLLSRPDARLQRALAGISDSELQLRVEQMDDSQLQWAAQQSDQIKAAGILGVIIAVLVIAILIVILIWLLDKDVDVTVKEDKD